MKYFALTEMVNGTKTTREVFPEFVHVQGLDVPLADRYHPDLVAQMVEVPEGTVASAVWDDESQSWVNPAEPELPAMDGGEDDTDTGNGNPPPPPPG